MKKIECILRPSKLEEVKESLNQYGVHGMTVMQVMGCGLQKGRKEVYRGTELTINLLPKVKIEIVVKDSIVEDVIGLLRKSAMTGQIGDGKIFVSTVDNVVRIRTGETGESAI
ncbi:MAG: P-II family nitrogen regulator [Bacillota bacterium]